LLLKTLWNKFNIYHLGKNPEIRNFISIFFLKKIICRSTITWERDKSGQITSIISTATLNKLIEHVTSGEPEGQQTFLSNPQFN
jgi:hypothetical protein